jgi:hypothetical protein
LQHLVIAVGKERSIVAIEYRLEKMQRPIAVVKETVDLIFEGGTLAYVLGTRQVTRWNSGILQ